MAVDKHILVQKHDANTHCQFTLSAAFGDPPIDDLVRVSEHYDYAAKGDDPGREYAYTVRVARTNLDDLVVVLAAKAAGIDVPADPEQAMLTCLRTLLDTGQLPTEPLKAVYTTLQKWLDEAGIPYTAEPWAWFNSD